MLLCWPCVSSCVYAPRFGPFVALRLPCIVLSVPAEVLAPSRHGQVTSIHRAAEKEGVLGNWASAKYDSRKPSFQRCRFSETQLSPDPNGPGPYCRTPLPLCVRYCKVLLVPGGGLAGGWALAREGSNPSPSARISPDKAAPLSLFTESPRRGVLGNSEALKEPGRKSPGVKLL
jgi:hypothetical protein